MVHGGKSLVNRPYRLDANGFYALCDNAAKLGKLPLNKIGELREILVRGEAAQNEFIGHMEALALNVPGLHPGKRFFIDGKTSHFDMIQILEFYPGYVLKKTTGGK
jgi:hypothetical protein